MKENLQYEHIAKYLAGELSDDEKILFEQWLQEKEENQQLLKEYQQLYKSSNNYEDNFEVNTTEAWQKFESNMNWNQENDTSEADTIAKEITMYSRNLWRIAAVFLFMAVGLLWIFQSNQNSTDWLVAQTMDSEKKEIQLPDGSSVWLNENTRLTYAPDFATNRQLTLQGEAFFDVQRDEEHPFVIESEQTITKVLGTSFNVRAYPNESFVEVNVASGKVSFAQTRSNKKPLILEKQELGRLDKSKWELQEYKMTDNNKLAWRTRNLTFKDTPLQTILDDIAHSYGITIKVENDQLNNCHFTGEFNDTNLQEVIQSIEFALNLQVNAENGIYTFSGEGCE